jgi:Phage protein (N4 Gp49/phage Sf6 gene 66) family
MQDKIQEEILAKGLIAPRVTPQDIEDNIQNEYYFTGGMGISSLNYDMIYESSLDLLTFCVLVLKNGFTVTGESACASPENFDAVLGKKIARQNAVNKIWPVMGYALKEKLSKNN